MGWIQKLYETYELCAGAPQFEKEPPLPVSHAEQQAHIEIVLDQDGNFQRATSVPKETTVVPATEGSAGRTGRKPPPHPLCDKIQYCAADYQEFGGGKEPFFAEYMEQLRQWETFDPNPKVHAVLTYVGKGTVVGDLVGAGELHCGPDGRLLTVWPPDTPTPGLFKMLTAKDKKRDQGDAFVRWRVQVPGNPISAVWQDPEVRDSWIRFDAAQKKDRALCMVTGEMTAVAESHPKRLRHGADGAKLISSNDSLGFTFRGRVDLPAQAYGVGSVVTQKAHNALRWLIARQGYRGGGGDPVFVAFAGAGRSSGTGVWRRIGRDPESAQCSSLADRPPGLSRRGRRPGVCCLGGRRRKHSRPVQGHAGTVRGCRGGWRDARCCVFRRCWAAFCLTALKSNRRLPSNAGRHRRCCSHGPRFRYTRAYGNYLLQGTNGRGVSGSGEGVAFHEIGRAS